MAYNPTIAPRDVFYFNEEWESVLGVDTLMKCKSLASVWNLIQLDEEPNPAFDSNFVLPVNSFDVRGFRNRVVTMAHRRPRLVPRNLWVPGDYVMAEDPQFLFQEEMLRYYYHPFLLMKREPTGEDERLAREALGLPLEDGPGERPRLKRGPNPKRECLPKPFSRGLVLNPLGPSEFPWALSILVSSGPIPVKKRDWAPGDHFRSEAHRRTVELRKKSGNPNISPVSMREVIWDKLKDRGVLVDSLPFRWQKR